MQPAPSARALAVLRRLREHQLLQLCAAVVQRGPVRAAAAVRGGRDVGVEQALALRGGAALDGDADEAPRPDVPRLQRLAACDGAAEQRQLRRSAPAVGGRRRTALLLLLRGRGAGHDAVEVDVAVLLLLCVCVQSAPAKTIAASRQVKKGTVKLAAAGLCSCRVPGNQRWTRPRTNPCSADLGGRSGCWGVLETREQGAEQGRFGAAGDSCSWPTIGLPMTHSGPVDFFPRVVRASLQCRARRHEIFDVR